MKFLLRYSVFILILILSREALPQNYELPAGVKIFTGTEIFQQFVGNTARNKIYAEYYLPPDSAERQGKLRGKSEVFGQYEGSWRIKGALFCIKYDKRIMSSRGDCYTVALNAENTRIYRMDGYEMYPDGGRLVVESGNPDNL